MLWAYSAAPQLIAEDEYVSFDAIICNTNGNATLDDERVFISKPGWYQISVNAVLSNISTSASITAGLRLVANDAEVEGSETQFVIPASGSAPVSISIPVHVVPADNGTAWIGWQMTDQATVDSAVIKVQRKI